MKGLYYWIRFKMGFSSPKLKMLDNSLTLIDGKLYNHDMRISYITGYLDALEGKEYRPEKFLGEK